MYEYSCCCCFMSKTSAPSHQLHATVTLTEIIAPQLRLFFVIILIVSNEFEIGDICLNQIFHFTLIS